ncbi:MAG: hypothetical protein AAFV45_07420 [Pseudomonadota bacterium]
MLFSSRPDQLISANWRSYAVVLWAVTAMPAGAAEPTSLTPTDKVGVEVQNLSRPILCAEKDNVTVAFRNPKVTGFSIEAAHPAYVNTLQKDSFAADWTDCDDIATGVITQKATPEKVTLYEDIDLWVTGYTFPKFWRDRKVPFTVKGKTNANFHLIQVWVRHNERAEEVLVVYPVDGYWRIRPLPPEHLGWSAYGSSFVIGPVEDVEGPREVRPVVNLTALEFDPTSKTFTMDFETGGTAPLTMSKLTNERMRLDVALSEPIKGSAFAALRSMYVTRFNADATDVAVLESTAKSWREHPVMTFTGAQSASSLWLGRLVPSRHNTSAPDHVVSNFKISAARQDKTEANPE